MDSLSELIAQAQPADINDLLAAVLARQRELYPDWDIIMISLEKSVDRTAQIDRNISFLERLKEESSDG